MTRSRISILPAAGLLALAACASAGASREPASSQPEPSAAESSSPTSVANEVPAPDGVPSALWDAVVADLVDRLDQPAPEIDLVSIKEMTWNDGSLGCPEPGQAYTQALVDGIQLIVAVGGERYDYRSAGGDSITLCESPLEGG